MSLVVTALVVPSIVLLAGGVLVSLFQRASASLRHQVWALAIFSAALIPLAVMMLPKWEIPIVTSSKTVMVVQPSSAQTTPVETAALPVAEVLPSLSLSKAQSGVGFGQWIFLVWVLGCGIVLARFLLGILAVVRLKRDSKNVEGDCWLPLVDELRSQLAIRRNVRVLVGEASFAPMTWGSVILLPEEAKFWTTERRYLVLAHELAHVKRHDGLLQTCVQLIAASYWFNPLLWVALKFLRAEREKACDDVVLNLGADGHTYASHLIEVAKGLRLSELSLATVSMAHPSQLETRIRAIMDLRTRRYPLSNLKILIGYCSVTTALVLLATVRVTATAVTTPIFAPPVVEVHEPAVTSAKPAQAPAIPVDHQEQVILRKDESEPQYQYSFYGATDIRERIMAQYGRPDSRESHSASRDGVTYVYQVWTYRHIPGQGDNVRFEFVDPGIEYRLAPVFNPPAVQFEQAKWAGTWKLNRDRSTVPRDSGFFTTFTSIDSFTLQLVPVPGGVSVTSEVSIIPPGEPAGSSRRAETRAKFTIMFGEITSVRSIMPFIDQNGTVMFQPTSDGFEITATSGTQTVRLIDVIRFVVSDDGRTLNETVNTVPGVVGVFEKQ